MNRLRELREEANLSMGELQRLVNINKSSLAFIELEQRKMTKLQLIQLSDFLNVSEDFLENKSSNYINIEDSNNIVYKLTYEEYIKIKDNLNLKILPKKEYQQFLSPYHVIRKIGKYEGEINVEETIKNFDYQMLKKFLKEIIKNGNL